MNREINVQVGKHEFVETILSSYIVLDDGLLAVSTDNDDNASGRLIKHSDVLDNIERIKNGFRTLNKLDNINRKLIIMKDGKGHELDITTITTEESKGRFIVKGKLKQCDYQPVSNIPPTGVIGGFKTGY
jgi:hypothetical protein